MNPSPPAVWWWYAEGGGFLGGPIGRDEGPAAEGTPRAPLGYIAT
jgi:hypothetical protein